MNKLIFMLLVVSGCSAATIERLSTEPFDGTGHIPSLTEVSLLTPPGPLGVDKRLYINNPLPYAVTVTVICSSTYQADQDVHVAAHSSRYIVVTTPRNRIGESCFIANVFP